MKMRFYGSPEALDHWRELVKQTLGKECSTVFQSDHHFIEVDMNTDDVKVLQVRFRARKLLHFFWSGDSIIGASPVVEPSG